LPSSSGPGFAPSAIGYGFGEKEMPWPNALRAWLGEIDATEDAVADEVLLETNIDDMNPQFTELLVERLFAAGALDAWLTPVVKKKGRLGVVVSVLCPAERQRDLVDLLVEQTTTLGVRSPPGRTGQSVRRSRRRRPAGARFAQAARWLVGDRRGAGVRRLPRVGPLGRRADPRGGGTKPTGWARWSSGRGGRPNRDAKHCGRSIRPPPIPIDDADLWS
jgi:hypothetical protein